MSIIESIKEKVFGEMPEDQSLKIIAKILKDNGGLKGLEGKFNREGHLDLFNSWISPGINQIITADQAQDIFGETEIQNLATSFSTSRDQIVDLLVNQLPDFVTTISLDPEAFPKYWPPLH